MDCSGLIFGVPLWVLVVVVLVNVSVWSMAVYILVISPLPNPVIWPCVIFLEVAAESTVGRAVELFIGKIIFGCVEDILESIRFVSWVSGVERKKSACKNFTVIQVESFKKF
jgi:uncharacterized membrane protein